MQYVVFVLGLICCGVALFFHYRDRRDYSQVQAEAVRQTVVPEAAEIQLLASDLVAELNQTAEKIVSDLEARANLLKGLIEEARAAAKELETKARSATHLEVREDVIRATVLPWDGPVPTISLLPLEPLDAPAVEPEARPAPVGPRPLSWREKEAAIQEMAGRGLDVVAIARELNIGRGEVKLILDLKKANAR